MIRLHETITAGLRPAPVIALALNTFDLPEHEAREAIARAEGETGLPATDPVRYDPSPSPARSRASTCSAWGSRPRCRDGVRTAQRTPAGRAIRRRKG
jgi:hypothetical protein